VIPPPRSGAGTHKDKNKMNHAPPKSVNPRTASNAASPAHRKRLALPAALLALSGIPLARLALATTDAEPPEAKRWAVHQFEAALARLTQTLLRYPKEALEKNIEGRASLSALYTKNLTPQPVKLVSSTGNVALDAQAIESMTKAIGALAAPELLKDDEFIARIRVFFILAAETVDKPL
jgi:outer membrane biosynthesis protein TonB